MTTLTNSNLPISSRDITLAKLVLEERAFNIPIYQRLYVWGDEQIVTLLEDLHNAFLTKDKQFKYYLGGVMVTENNGKFDLIDGQQRFTTLWLVSSILAGELEAFTKITINKVDQSRLSFSVRDFATQYFNQSASMDSFTKEELEELNPIINGKRLIINFINSKVQDHLGFSKYIYENVYFVLTQMPQNTDENKVFEAMNNRGMQLQQHEILKAKLLSFLKSDMDEMGRYGLLWDACSMMDDYLEKNIKLVADLKWKELFTDLNEDEEKIVELPSDIHGRLSIKKNGIDGMDLLSILNEPITEEEKKTGLGMDDDTEAYDSGKVRSIINFPMLLLHTLRIYQFRVKKIKHSELIGKSKEEGVVTIAEVKGKDLISIFNKHKDSFDSADDVKKFIDLLWKVRELFDKHIIKWVSNGENNEEVHLIKKLYQNKTAFQRRALTGIDGFALLQSMLYHSQQIITHYWLTPLLNKMLDSDDQVSLFIYLEKLDNAMFCNEKEDLRTLSYRMMELPESELRGDFTFVNNTLRQASGISFPSYWFYKLEYILWKNRDFLNLDENKKDKWKEYKMTAKNSVEHISPQNPDKNDTKVVYSLSDSNEEIERKKNDFGNLVLLSPGMNSEYSNKTYNAKRTDYGDKKRLDSLKSDLIFSNENWSWEICEVHRNKMISLFINHLES